MHWVVMVARNSRNRAGSLTAQSGALMATCRREFIRETIANKSQCRDTHQMLVNAGSRGRGKAALCFSREAFSAFKDYRE
ncbi:MAG: hypothetical protein KJ884_17370 [Gammaproteobacteria bacterium]|nr:hypothetical protein [Gammaproteobacteria bacterium]MBU1489497.1 hypothetical protein [Gammaproteobacteria bacterium]MBU2066738.1 hypothetical protein [Gammaproteobacteria bacterium]MBU2137837.1 hypothetical protein [Gammaproteobacteria bacterium]MBU2214993.1 hypothetical protein [Gammaproteobacteria bacterium]